jgi:hypothetical protein
VPKAITSAAVSVGGAAKDALADTPFGEYAHGIEAGADQFNAAGKTLLGYETMPEVDPQARAEAQAATATMSKWSATGEDPRVTGALGRTIFGPVKALSILAAATPAVGPWGAAALYGGTEGRETYQQDVASGIDPTTAKEHSALTGTLNAAGALIPGMGGSLPGKIAAGIGANVGLDVAGRAASSAVLRANGYTAQADQQKIFDGQSLMADVILGAAFGLHSHLTEGVKPAQVNPADVDTSAAVLAQSHFDRSAPGIPTDPAVANAHVRVMSEALDSLANGDTPNVSAEDARTIAEGTLPDPVHTWDDTSAPAGFVRMFHGAYDGGEPNTGGSRWFATTPEYAAGYGAGGRNVWYVDVPTGHPALTALVDDFDVANGFRQRYGNSELPEELAKQAKPYRPTNVLVEAAHAELPGFTDAVAPIRYIEPPEFIDTRGSAIFHGTSREIPGDSPSDEYAMSGDNRNIFGQGFYTTDAADVAAGYMRKGKGDSPTLYRVREKPGANLYDMESPLTPETRQLAHDIFGDLTPSEDIDGKPIENMRALFNEFRADSQNNGLSRDEVQGYFDSFRTELEKKGFNGLAHIGGKTGKGVGPHQVRIYWNPEKHVSLARDELSNYKQKPTGKPLGPLPPDAEGKPAPAQFDSMTQQRIDHLTSHYGDLQVTREDGSVGTVSQIAREMQGQMADADAMSQAHEAAAACFLRSGGAA